MITKAKVEVKDQKDYLQLLRGLTKLTPKEEEVIAHYLDNNDNTKFEDDKFKESMKACKVGNYSQFLSGINKKGIINKEGNIHPLLKLNKKQMGINFEFYEQNNK